MSRCRPSPAPESSREDRPQGLDLLDDEVEERRQPGRLDALFRSAGFQDVATTALDAVFHLPSVDHYLAFVRSSASPILQILGRLDASAAEAAWSEMRERLSTFTTRQGWEGPNELLLTVGRRAREPT